MRLGNCVARRNSPRVAFATTISILHDDNPIGALLELGQSMRRQKYDRAAIPQLPYQFVKLFPESWIETAGWLIKQERARIAEECLRQTQTLAHAFGIGGNAPSGSCCQPYAVKQTERRFNSSLF